MFENAGVYEGDVDAAVCPVGAHCTYTHTAGLRRQTSRLLYDLPDQQIRLEFGDTEAIGAPLQRTVDMMGVSVEKSAAKLAPGESTGITGGTTLRLERTSDIDVIVNGAVVQHLKLRPGTYNLRDLPLGTGANEVKLEIVDDNGQRRTEKFTTYSSNRLLAAGKSEWAVNAGLPSYLRDDERGYESASSLMGTGYFRYGLTDALTAETHLQGDRTVTMGGAGLKTSTPIGVFGLGGAASTGTFGTGWAADAAWDMINFTGLLSQKGENFTLSAEYRSHDFHRPGDIYATSTGILYPEFNYWLRLASNYSLTLDGGIGLSLSARYQFGDPQQALLSPYTITGDRYGADLSLSRVLTPTVNGSLLIGYSNESFLRDAVATSPTAKPELRVGIRFDIRPDDQTFVATNYDSLNRQATVSARHSEGAGIGHWDTEVDLQQLGYTDTATATGALNYYGNRAEVHVIHYAQASGVAYDKFTPSGLAERTSLKVGSSIAFADGSVAVGPPIRGNAFAIVTPHDTIADKDVVVGDAASPRGYADKLGPAVVGDLPAYSPSTVPVDVPDLPIGYSLGAGAYDLNARYRSGYRLEVGSAYSVSAFGVLVDRHDQPIALATGTAISAADAQKRVSFFTNSAGKFGIEGLAPGRWVIEIANEGESLRFALEVPAGETGLFKAGTLKPMGAEAH